MYAPRVFVSMLGALTIFAVVTYVLNGSLVPTLIQTAICAVLIQLGYFLAIIVLVWKKARESERQAAEMSRSPGEDTAGGKTAPLNRPGHLNR
ncbi:MULTISPECIES: exopolysaccharide production repressor protein [unclassified Ensifer]|uniref:exopolysaccharide production repressor protein n=1 Tax=unclassified Ensifer TaxID=2633371 RepID=UPI00081360CC|nr:MULTISPECIES: exopolysaccharide production repressor protein [unclassified Ensifer]OCP03393.1 exopolysaccharide production repressor exox [Ensifer sp. LC14]OCP03725.1 exopolysaccharide production repressor exox [Ensifer sp. LC11]OCP03874.1 exopolysaccharide production repressor exox [Ensifer sp. LC13]OCP30288.1 exopolysaccharide production repressor exox [Ensifer sp. LC499]